jgi:phage tail-like protein
MFDAASVEPRTKNKFRVEIEGLEVAYVASVQIPDAELGTMEHAASGQSQPTKYASGQMQFGDIELKKIMPAQSPDSWAYNWLTKAVDPASFQHGPPSSYKRDIQIHHLNGAGAVVQTWNVAGAFCKKIGYDEQGSQDGDKLLQNVTLACDYYVES